jgi:hypothetical protein
MAGERRVVHIRCGEFQNKSEETAFRRIEELLDKKTDSGPWRLLSNLTLFEFGKAYEMDLVVLGARRFFHIEVKHYTPSGLCNDANFRKWRIATEEKAKKLKGILSKSLEREIPWVKGVFLLTQDGAVPKNLQQDLGGKLFTLSQCAELLELDTPSSQQSLSASELDRLVGALEPRSPLYAGKLRNLGPFSAMEPIDIRDQQYRVYTAKKQGRSGRVELHLYDLTASPEARNWAERHSEALRTLPHREHVLQLIDTFQPIPGFEGELYFFTTEHSASPSLAKRRQDPAWGREARLVWACSAAQALAEFHEDGFLHRNISDATLLVRSDGEAVFTGWNYTRLPSAEQAKTISLAAPPRLSPGQAPELAGGLQQASPASDVYALCCALEDLDLGAPAEEFLRLGLGDDPAQRLSAADLAERLRSLLQAASAPPALPPADVWDERTTLLLPLGPNGDATEWKISELLGGSGERLTFEAVEEVKAGQPALTKRVVIKAATGEAEGARLVATYQGLRKAFAGGFLGQSALLWAADSCRLAPRWPL